MIVDINVKRAMMIAGLLMAIPFGGLILIDGFKAIYVFCFVFATSSFTLVWTGGVLFYLTRKRRREL